MMPWRDCLAEYSADVLRVSRGDDLADVDEERAAGRLGFEGAVWASWYPGFEAIGLHQVRAEAVPMFLHASRDDGSVVGRYRRLLRAIVTPEELEAYEPPSLPEPPDFEDAMRRARQRAQDGSPDDSDSPHRIAPVVPLIDPTLPGG